MSQRVRAKRSPMTGSAKCETGWGDLSTRALFVEETLSPHPDPCLASLDADRPSPSRGG
jgi:hypothetical protein